MKTRNTLILRIALGLMLILLGFISTFSVLPPRAVPPATPATRFSAIRAMADLEVVARQPHGAGSEAQQRVREYILGQVEALGLNAQVEKSGKISNILVRLPGTDPTQVVLVTGHYDSHPPAPGAGDDGLSTVALLESLRVLQASPALRNDVLFLFTDGEELGYLGASSFLLAHPQAQDEIGLVLCFDGVPGNGPLTLRQTSVGDAWLVRQMTGLKLAMYAGNWTNRTERGETDCDCSIFDNAGFTNVEIENEHAGSRYHTSHDSADAISPDLVQSFGKTMLALTRHFGSIDLRTRSEGPDLVYFTLPLVGLVAYPGWLMPVLSGLGLLGLLVFVVVAWRRRLFSPWRFGLGLLGILLGLVLIVLSAQLAWGRVEDNLVARLVAGNGFDARPAWMAGFMVGALLLMTIVLSLLSRLLGGANLAVAAILFYLAIGFVFYFIVDGDNPLTTAWSAWPLLGSVAGLGVLLFTKNPVWKVVLLACCALPILTLQVPYLWLGSYTSEDAWIPVLVVCAMVGLFVPQVEAIFGKSTFLGESGDFVVN